MCYLLYSQMFEGGIVGNFVVAGSPFLAGIFIAWGVCLQKNNKK